MSLDGAGPAQNSTGDRADAVHTREVSGSKKRELLEVRQL
jgi:hypothetical protein